MSVFVEGLVCHVAAAQLLHGPLQCIPGIFPVSGCIAVIVFGNQPVQIIFDPNQIVLHQWEHRIIKPLPLAVGQPLLRSVEQLRKMVQAEALAVFHPAAELRI